MKSCFLLLAALMMGLAGCGATDGPVVRGKVSLDGKPLSDAEVLFEPQSPEQPGASVRTAADGTFVIVPNETTGETLLPGQYAVVISKKVSRNGKAPADIDGDLEQLEAAGMVRETLPSRYSVRTETTLVAEIKSEPNELSFDLKSK